MNGLYISPAIIALAIFYYMAYKQKLRRAKRRNKIVKKQAEMLKMIQAAAAQNF